MSAIEKEQCKLSTLVESFFRLAETVTYLSESQISKDRTYSSWCKLIFWLVETIFFYCLRHFSRTPSSWLVEIHFSVQKRMFCFLFRAFRSCQQPLFKLESSLVKTLSLATVFFVFSDIPVNGSSFPSSKNVFSNEFSIHTSGNRFSVQLKQQIFFFLLVMETRKCNL